MLPRGCLVTRDRSHQSVLARTLSTCSTRRKQHLNITGAETRDSLASPSSRARAVMAPFSAREVDRLHAAGLRASGISLARQEEDMDVLNHALYSFRSVDDGPPPPPSRFPVLVLNSDLRPLTLFPITFVSWFQALKAAMRGRVNVVAFYGVTVKTTGNQQYSLPAVVSVLTPVPGRPIMEPNLRPFRRNIFLRDDYLCVYCGHKFTHGELTLDHLIPQCLGGDSSWRNLVSACKRCNSTKGAKLPQQLHELNMQLRKQPEKPTPYELRQKYVSQLPDDVMHQWSHYLFRDCDRHQQQDANPQCC